ncbi:ACN9-domain-containing protein [Hesseltinella vesiculosa]|uniref:Succinate dehydrogenase assembly factor 3 n=1 Tax=Hesseltinella vesiculosa TaxID=101127 RepID=A0A1X2G347_9FUNG|nr:ACN9-domain-containing protein [Hesseltinella vesiculosa]
MRAFGDDYVKSEFHRHKTSDNPVHIVGFITQWQDYLDLLSEQTQVQADNKDASSLFTNIPDNGMGKKLNEGHLDKMSDEQLGQLYELRTKLQDTLGDKK